MGKRQIRGKEGSSMRTNRRHQDKHGRSTNQCSNMVLCTKDQEDTRPGLMVILFAFHFSRKWLDTLHQIWERSVLYGLGLSSENEFCFLKIWLTLLTQGRVGHSHLGKQVEFRICKQTNKIYRNSTQPLIKKYTWWTPERLVCYQPQTITSSCYNLSLSPCQFNAH